MSHRTKQARMIEGLSPSNAAHRISAYTYGNILALGALVLVSAEDIEHGHALVVLLATGLTTFLAHFLAESQEHRLLHGNGLTKADVKDALRNAVPIVSSTLTPAFFLALAMFHLVPGKVSWYLAVLALVGRLFSVGFVVAHYRKESVTFRTLLGGIIFAVLGFTVAALKAVLTH